MRNSHLSVVQVRLHHAIAAWAIITNRFSSHDVGIKLVGREVVKGLWTNYNKVKLA